MNEQRGVAVAQLAAELLHAQFQNEKVIYGRASAEDVYMAVHNAVLGAEQFYKTMDEHLYPEHRNGNN